MASLGTTQDSADQPRKGPRSCLEMTTLRLSGRLERDIVLLFVEQLSALTQADHPAQIHLEAAEVCDSQATTVLVDALRQTAERIGTLEITDPPKELEQQLAAGAPLFRLVRS